jgi:hypothetical protein
MLLGAMVIMQKHLSDIIRVLENLPLLLLFLLTLGQLTGSDNTGLALGSFVGPHRLWNEHANLLLIRLVLWILAGRDDFGQPSGALEQEDERSRAHNGPAVQRVGGVTAPLVQEEPDALLGKEVGVSGVGPEPGGEKAPVERAPGIAHGDILVLVVLVLDRLIPCASVNTAIRT